MTDLTITADNIHVSGYSSTPQSSWVNRPERGIRIIHLPTGIEVTCETERSQHANKAKALKELTQRLQEIREEKIFPIGSGVSTPVGSGEVVAYELLRYSGVTASLDRPEPGESFRYMVKLWPGHTWSIKNQLCCVFPNEIQLLIGG